MTNIGARKIKGRLMLILVAVAFIIIMIPLISMLYMIIKEGIGILSWEFLTALPKPPGEVGGGIGNAIQGSLIIVALASMVSIPISIFAAMCISEYGGKLSMITEFIAEVLSGTPSIIAGIFIYTLIVLRIGFSALAGALALSVLMIPTVTIASYESLKAVPRGIREAAIALGVPKWRASLFVILRSAMVGIGTGVILGVARIFGETAPLLFTTSLGNMYWNEGLLEPTAALPLLIYDYATSPYKSWQARAWGAALVLLVIVLLLNIGVRIIARKR
ncbi:MAG: phosphate ABC transporter permease PstA [Candidatus Thermoplasmatota archaeon]|nr:phosphate ABC transporter permease PstA [Candidatus Thermoplasmatota archaeon]